jgi:beta-lactamase class C
MGFGLIGYAVANASGKPYYALLKESILEPLGMRTTFIHVPPEYHRNYAQGYNQLGRAVPHASLNAWPAGGALHSTLADMLLFLKANLGLTGPGPLLKAMQYAQQSYFTVNPHFDMGLGWQRIKSKYGVIIDKNGGLEGSSSYIGMIPSENMGIVILTNKGRTQVTGTGRKILVALSQQKKDNKP